jgi:pimeloyl-ACP methyl ester carboxylesterase
MSNLTERANWRAPILGAAKTLDLPGGRIRYHDVGSGPALVFVHGLLVNANLWRKLVERLSGDFRCVVLDLPFGSHRLPLGPAAPRGPMAAADMVADAIEALDLDDVTLIGNDSGGAISQIVVTTRPERIGRLVLTSCDYRENFPPKIFSYIKPAAAVPGLLWALLQPMRLRLPIERAAEDSYVLPAIHERALRDDARALIKGADISQTIAAADLLHSFDRPALIAWSADDRVFPVADAHRLATELPQGRVELVPDAYTFSMEDNPDRLAQMIADFVRESPSGVSSTPAAPPSP